MLFPHVCEICGSYLPSTNEFVCNNCLDHRFEVSNIEFQTSTSGVMLPEHVIGQFALWNFDKGGHLQDLLHKLKYHHLHGVGFDLGKKLGSSLKNHPTVSINEDWTLIPVPLHKKKKHKRGFNQARAIAEGVAVSLESVIVDEHAVIRIKNTKTQTGFTLDQRNSNINNAFLVMKPNQISNKNFIIVDDVYTTGATTFELAKMLVANGANKIFIATVAQA